jgi:exopolysaccharide biosynthesis WecB/TagA/CpsF family protein
MTQQGAGRGHPKVWEGTRVRIGPLTVDDVTIPDILGIVRTTLEDGRQIKLFYANAHAVRLASEDAQFATDLNTADLIVCDSYGIQLAARFLGHSLHPPLTPPTWIGALVQSLSPSCASLYLLGDEPAVVSAAARALESSYPSAKVVGYHHGFFAADAGDEEILAEINIAMPTVVLVGMGMPRQERWIARYAYRLKPPILIAVGALFRRLAGVEARPPTWIAKSGLEWLVRLLRHPIKLFDRYVIGLPRFALVIGRQKWSARAE